MLIAVNYHYVRPSFSHPYEGIHGITPAALERQLGVLGQAGEFVDSRAVRAAARGEKSLPDRAILVTFDDGLREQYEQAWPALRRQGIPAIFFVNTRPIVERTVCTVHKIHLLRSQVPPHEFLRMLHGHATELRIDLHTGVDNGRAEAQYPFDRPAVARLKYLLNSALTTKETEALVNSCFRATFAGEERSISESLYMDAAQIRELGAEYCIGTHGHDHLPLGLLEPQHAREMIGLSISHLQRLIGYPPFALSYPYGSLEACSPTVAEVAAKLGIEFAFTMERAGNDAGSMSRRFFLARFDCNDLPGGKAEKWTASEMFAMAQAARWNRNGNGAHA